MYIHGDLMCYITVDTKKTRYFIGWHMKYAWRYANYSQDTQIQGIEISLCIHIYMAIYTAGLKLNLN